MSGNNSAVKDLLTRAAEAKNSTDIPDPIELAENWLDKNGIKIISMSSMEHPLFPDFSEQEISEMFVVDMLKTARASVKGINDSFLSKGFNIAVAKRYAEFKDTYVQRIKYAPEKEAPGKEELKKWLKHLTGEVRVKDLVVMQHFLWQVIRKMHKKKVTWHLMPVLVGPQGGGKTEAVSNLLNPINYLVAKGQSVDFIERAETAYPLLASNYVCQLDEMSKASRTDVNKLKSVISLEELTYRMYHTQKHPTKKNLCTFIGTSNESLADQIKDNSGMRRFFEIRTANNKGLSEAERRKVWAAINAIDYQLIWEGINPNQNEPYIIDYLDAINDDQEALRTKDAVELFVEEKGIIVNAERAMSGLQLYKVFKTYCEEAGLKHTLTRQNFYRKLESKGVPRTEGPDKRVTYFGCMLDNSALTSSLLSTLGSIKTQEETAQ